MCFVRDAFVKTLQTLWDAAVLHAKHARRVVVCSVVGRCAPLGHQKFFKPRSRHGLVGIAVLTLPSALARCARQYVWFALPDARVKISSLCMTIHPRHKHNSFHEKASRALFFRSVLRKTIKNKWEVNGRPVG